MDTAWCVRLPSLRYDDTNLTNASMKDLFYVNSKCLRKYKKIVLKRIM